MTATEGANRFAEQFSPETPTQNQQSFFEFNNNYISSIDDITADKVQFKDATVDMKVVKNEAWNLFFKENFNFQSEQMMWQQNTVMEAQNWPANDAVPTPQVEIKHRPSVMAERKTFFAFAPMFFAKDANLSRINAWLNIYRQRFAKLNNSCSECS